MAKFGACNWQTTYMSSTSEHSVKNHELYNNKKGLVPIIRIDANFRTVLSLIPTRRFTTTPIVFFIDRPLV